MVDRLTAPEGYDSDYPFSQASIHRGTLYTAGQVPKDPETREIVAGGIEPQARRTLENLGAILAAADADFSDVVRATVYLTDMADYERFNGIYREYVPAPRPPRTCVAVDELAIDVRVEIDMIAAL
jgi:2-iminobutanoate/2-iminopropanoate deaminase